MSMFYNEGAGASRVRLAGKVLDGSQPEGSSILPVLTIFRLRDLWQQWESSPLRRSNYGGNFIEYVVANIG